MFAMSWDGINPVQMSRSVRTVLFHGQNGTILAMGWNKSCIDVKVGAHCIISWPKWDYFGHGME